jgi:hypothetical protein
MRLGKFFEGYKHKDVFWFRIFGYGLAFDNRLRFSQKYGHTKYYKFFGKIITPLKPYKRWTDNK